MPRATWPIRTARIGKCHEILTTALAQVQNEPWFAACEGWLYRGMWMSWPIHEVDPGRATQP